MTHNDKKKEKRSGKLPTFVYDLAHDEIIMEGLPSETGGQTRESRESNKYDL